LFGVKGYGAVLGTIATPVLVVNAASPTAFAWIVDRWGWETGRVVLLVSCSAAWLAIELMWRWYERQRGPGPIPGRPGGANRTLGGNREGLEPARNRHLPKGARFC
jgi:hypothetical protein